MCLVGTLPLQSLITTTLPVNLVFSVNQCEDVLLAGNAQNLGLSLGTGGRSCKGIKDGAMHSLPEKNIKTIIVPHSIHIQGLDCETETPALLAEQGECMS